jgi:Asp-tRNA(Asn)/Glu-tRNA(Gln) amidotransferase A subunit family amidase
MNRTMSTVGAAASSAASDLVMMDAAALQNSIRTRQASCVEVMAAYLNHVERINPKVNAIVALQYRAGLLAHAWQQGSRLLAHYSDPTKRAALKPDAIFEVESGMKLSGYDLASASVVRSEWYHALRWLFDRYDYFIVPTAQMFPFAVETHWPQEIAGRKMDTYHEWMKANCLISMCGCPALAAPAGFGSEGLPIGFQIVAPHVVKGLACNSPMPTNSRPSGLACARRRCLLSHKGSEPPRLSRGGLKGRCFL